MPQALTLIRTSPGATEGTGTSRQRDQFVEAAVTHQAHGGHRFRNSNHPILP